MLNESPPDARVEADECGTADRIGSCLEAARGAVSDKHRTRA